MWARVGLLVGVLLIGSASAQSPSPVPYPQRYQTTMVKYAVVDRSDGLSRDLYASRDAIEAVKQDPRLKEFPAGVLFALDVYSAKVVSQDRKTGGPVFEVGADGHLVRSKSEHTLHLMRKSQPGFGSQNWTFGGFDPQTAEPLKLQLPGDCLLCHQAAVRSDMSFSLSLLRRFVTTGAVQYSFCAQPGRQLCPF
jgi:cytochrome P460